MHIRKVIAQQFCHGEKNVLASKILVNVFLEDIYTHSTPHKNLQNLEFTKEG